MNSREIQHALFAQLGNASKLMVPNYTPAEWFECDLYRITKAGYAEEFEIKISVADFKADAKKGPDDRDRLLHEMLPDDHWRKQKFDGRTKHERISAGDLRGPSRFWFAMPDDIAKKVEIPVWAGLITVRDYHGRAIVHVAKRGPRLHKAPPLAKVIDHARGVFYWRYWALRRGKPEETATTQ